MNRVSLFISLLVGLVFIPILPSPAAETPVADQIQTHVLANGLKVIFKENHALPLVALDLWIKTGSAEDPPGASGTAHLLEHMLFKGTQKRGEGQVDEAMENLGASMEAATSQDWCHLYSTVASRFYPQALDVFADVVRNATVPAEALKREKGVIVDEMALAGADPIRKLEENLDALAYGNHPYGRPIPGDLTPLLKISRETLLQAQKRLFVGSNLALVVVGDFNVAQALKEIETGFSPIPSDTVSRAKLEAAQTPKTGGGEKAVAVSGKSAYVLIGFPGPSVDQPKEATALDLIFSTLSLGDNGRLQRSLVKRGLARQVRVDFLTQRGPGLFIVAAECEPEQTGRVREVIEQELASLRETPLSEDDLSAARRRLLSSIAFDTETYGGQAANLGFYEALGHPELARQYPDLIRHLTTQEIQETAKKYLAPSQSLRLIARPKSAGEAPPSGQPEIVPLPGLEDTKTELDLPSRPFCSINRKKAVSFTLSESLSHFQTGGSRCPRSRTHGRRPVARNFSSSRIPLSIHATKNTCIDTSTVLLPTPSVENGPGTGGKSASQKIVLPSGLTVIVKPVPGQQILAVRLFVKAGAAEETESPAGTSALLARLLINESAHPSIKDDLGFLADQVGGGLSAEPGEDATGFSVLTLRDRFNDALDLLAYVATEPRIKDSDVVEQRQLLTEGEREPADTFQAGMAAMVQRLYPGSRLGLPVNGTSETRKAITPQMLSQFWSDHYRLGNMVVVVAGDVKPQTVIARVDEAFRKKIPSGQDNSATVTPKDPAVVGHTVLERPVAAGMAAVGVRAPGALDAKFPALSVLSAMLGGGKGSRLFRALREAQGIGYDLGTWSPPRSRNGYLVGYVIAYPFRPSPDGTPQPILETARKTILKEMQSLADGPFTDAELARARRYVIGTYALRHQRVSEDAYLLGWWGSLGGGSETDADFPDKVSKVTKEEVASLAHDLFHDFSTLVMLPDDSAQPSPGDEP